MATFFSTGEFGLFSPDFTVEDGFVLTEYGSDARVLHLPGHSKGSIGILTTEGELFCGDLIYNWFGVPKPLYIDDMADFHHSFEKLKALSGATVAYPGHGKPFALQQFVSRRR